MEKIFIIGAGQMGGSIAWAAALRGVAEHIGVYDRDQSAVTVLLERIGPQKRIVKIMDPFQEASNADLVIFATPLDQFAHIAKSIGPFLKTGAIVMDIGSGKVQAIEQIYEHLYDDVEYVPAHPLTGRAGQGPLTAEADMFVGQKIAIVPDPLPDWMALKAQASVKNFWQALGGVPVLMEASTHDRLYGTISHLQHLIVFTTLGLAQADSEKMLLRDAYHHAGNFMRDLTRVGDATPAQWLPVFANNKDAIAKSAFNFRKILQELTILLEQETPSALHNAIQAAHHYAADMHTRPRETLAAEFNDVGDDPLAITSVIALPALLAAAIALNTQELENSLKLKIAEVVNPSFLDGTRALTNLPGELVKLLWDNRPLLISHVHKFLHLFDVAINAVHEKDAQFLTSYIESARSMRLEMPKVRKPNEEAATGDYEVLRPEFMPTKQ